MVAAPQRTDVVHQNVCVLINRDDDIMRRMAGTLGSSQGKALAGPQHDSVGCHAKIFTRRPKGEAWIERVLIADEERSPTIHTVAIKLYIQVSEP